MDASQRLAGLLFAIGLSLLHGVGADVGVSHSEVTWLEVRTSISETICVPASEGTAQIDPVLGDRAACARTGKMSALAAVVDAAIADAMPLIASIPGYLPPRITEFRALSAASSRSARDDQAMTVFLEDPSFLDPVMSRIMKALKDRHTTCQDCPSPRSHVVRSVSVNDVGPYVLAFVSLDPIESRANDGTPLKTPKYAFHVCSGATSIATLPHDDLLARVGFLAARGMRSTVGDHLLEIVAGDEFKKRKTDNSRTDYARTRLHDVLAGSADLKSTICETSMRFGPEVGFSVDGCPQ